MFPDEWDKAISPGSRINMSMMLDAVFAVEPDECDDACPMPTCSGRLQAALHDFLRIWFVLCLPTLSSVLLAYFELVPHVE